MRFTCQTTVYYQMKWRDDNTVDYSPSFFIEKLIDCQKCLHTEDMITARKRFYIKGHSDKFTETAWVALSEQKVRGMCRFLATTDVPNIFNSNWADQATQLSEKNVETVTVSVSNDFGRALTELDNKSLLDYVIFSTLPGIFDFLLTKPGINNFISFLKTIREFSLPLSRLFTRVAFLTPDFCLFIREVAFDLLLPFMNYNGVIPDPEAFLSRFVAKWKANVIICPSHILGIFKEAGEEEACEILYHGFFALFITEPRLFWAADIHQEKSINSEVFTQELCSSYIKDIVTFMLTNVHELREPSITTPFEWACLNNIDCFIIRNITEPEKLKTFLTISEYHLYSVQLSNAYDTFPRLVDTLSGLSPWEDSLRKLLRTSSAISPVFLTSPEPWTVVSLVKCLTVDCGPSSTLDERRNEFDKFARRLGKVTLPRSKSALVHMLDGLIYQHKQEVRTMSQSHAQCRELDMRRQRYAFLDRPTENLFLYRRICQRNVSKGVIPRNGLEIALDVQRSIRDMSVILESEDPVMDDPVMDLFYLMSSLHLTDFCRYSDTIWDELFSSAMRYDRARVVSKVSECDVVRKYLDYLLLFKSRICSCFEEDCSPVQKLFRLDKIFGDMWLYINCPIAPEDKQLLRPAALLLAEPLNLFSNIRYFETFHCILSSPKFGKEIADLANEFRGVVELTKWVLPEFKDEISEMAAKWRTDLTVTQKPSRGLH